MMVRLEPGEGSQVPSGKLLRLTLMQICDTACRTREPVVDLGESPTGWAAALGLELDAAGLRDLTAQMERLLSGRIAVSTGGPELFMLDARGLRRPDHGGWRQQLRLNSRFLASLLDTAVPLDREVFRRLAAAPDALDVYAWMAQGLHRFGGAAFTEGWADLQQRFGRGTQTTASFRPGIEEVARTVARADPSLIVTWSDAGVDVRREDGPVARRDAAAAGSSAEAVRPTADSPEAEEPAVPALAEPAEIEAAQVACPDGPVQGTAPQSTPARAERTPPAHLPPHPTAITQDRVSLLHHVTGLPQVIWLRRGHGEENIVIGATPGPRFDPDRLTVLAVEPMLLQVSGGLQQREFDLVSAWVMANRDLIDDFWEGSITSFEELRDRVQQQRSPA